ncbi:MAG: acylphosphatase [Spongiibacteraceae bacterium]|nr:acylphosphatase [Spongiibacteraceae bacterium]
MPEQTNQCCIHAVVTGRVQGVWFRAFVCELAREHKVTGWANNQVNGSVDVMLCGQDSAVHTVLNALHEGPPLSKVLNVAHNTAPWQPLSEFTTG